MRSAGLQVNRKHQTGLDPSFYGSRSLRRTEVTLIYRRTRKAPQRMMFGPLPKISTGKI